MTVVLMRTDKINKIFRYPTGRWSARGKMRDKQKTIAMETNGPKNRILAHFLGGGSLTVLRALDLYSTTELRSVVWRLRQDGYDIRNRRIRVKAADGGLRHVKEYFLFR